MNRTRQTGFTLIEMVIAVVILAVLIGLLVPAVQKVREAAQRARCANQLRQIAAATHAFAADHDSRLPVNYGTRSSPNYFDGVHWALLKYLDGGALYVAAINTSAGGSLRVEVFVSPADPSFAGHYAANVVTVSSYAANGQLFRGGASLTASLGDGTSNTLMFAEHYSKCDDTFFLHNMSRLFYARQARPPTFADPGSPATDGVEPNDVVPVTTGYPPVTTSSTPGLTFQVRPVIHGALPRNGGPPDVVYTPPPGAIICDPRVPQTAHQSGMLVALVDGSVRSIHPGVANATFWAAVTPAGGEVAPLD